MPGRLDHVRRAAVLTAVVAVGTVLPLRLAASAHTDGGDSSHSNSLPTALPGYGVGVFARATAAYSHPDSIAVDGGHVWVGYQNVTAKDGSDGNSSTIVEYTLGGPVLHTFSASGHNDGLRVDPATHRVWAQSNEDGNPALTVIDPSNQTTKVYSFAAPAHGGGYDDIAFVGGQTFLSASKPTLNAQGQNTFPALVTAQLIGGTVQVTPVLNGNATATDIITHQTVALNLIDPDSCT